MIASRNIDDLHPIVSRMAFDWLAACDRAGLDVLITSTLRDDESQNALYAIGRTKKGSEVSILRPMGRIVTNARGGQSFHNYGLAFDFVPLIHGKPQWNDLKAFQRCGEIGEALGLEWAGRWKSFREYAHLQWTGGLSLAQLQAGRRPATEGLA